MRTLFALTVAAALTLGLTGAALAQGATGGGAPGSKSTGDPAKPPSNGGMTSGGGAMRGQHRVMGEVTKLDQSQGRVSLKTDMGDMELHFPPSALQGIKEGDRVEVQLGLRPAGASGAGSTPVRPGTTSGSPTKSPAAPAAEGATSGKQPGIQSQGGAPGSPKSP
jgi:hypothetical protein